MGIRAAAAAPVPVRRARRRVNPDGWPIGFLLASLVILSSPCRAKWNNLYDVKIGCILTLSRLENDMTKKVAKKPANASKSAAYHHGDLKRELVAAGRRVLEQSGVEGLSLRGVAREAGVSQAAPYHHFADKDGLLAAIAAEGFGELSAEMAKRSAGAENPGAHMGGLGAGYIVFAFQNPELFRLMHGPRFVAAEKYDDLLVIAAESFTMLRDGVAACLDGASESEIDSVCTAAWSLVHGASMLIVDKRIDVGTTVEEIAAFANDLTSRVPIGPRL